MQTNDVQNYWILSTRSWQGTAIANKQFFKQKYQKKSKLKAEFIGRGGTWLDTGSIKDFYDTSAFVSTLENRQGLKIACLEEIAFNNNWIKKDKILSAIKFYGNCSYSKYLNKILK